MFIERALAGLGQLGGLDQPTTLVAARDLLARIMVLYNKIAPSSAVPAYADANNYLRLGREQALAAIQLASAPIWVPEFSAKAQQLIDNAYTNFLAAQKIVKDIKASADAPPPAPTHDPLPKLNGGVSPPPVVQAGVDMKTVAMLGLMAFLMMRKG